jgi:hypothetical protein
VRRREKGTGEKMARDGGGNAVGGEKFWCS